MIKFFRKIRQNLLSKGKTGKYLKYAIGEIILVMVGILLALQVTNWNSERKDRISERKLLDNIHRDFTANKVNFDSLKVFTYRNVATLDSIIALFPIDKDSVKIKAFWKHNKNIEDIRYNAYSSTVETIINSNSLELIENEKLQGFLMSWKDVLLDFQEEENSYHKMISNDYWPYFLDVFDYSLKDSDKNSTVISSIKFQNLIFSRKSYLRNVIDAIESEPIENHIKQIIRLTDYK
jgi:hypothetical protein